MRSRRSLTLLLLATTAIAQGASDATLPSPTTARPPASAVESGTEPVIVIQGMCDGNTAKDHAHCSTVITKQEFEVVMDVLKATGHGVVPPVQRDVARGYADVRIFAAAATKAGIDKDPRFQEVLQLARMRALADMYRLKLQEEARQISPEEVASYYHEHLSSFEELTLRRITLPRNRLENSNDLGYRAKAAELAAELRDRASNGEGMDRLQSEAFQTLGLKSPPPTLMGPVRRGAYDPKIEQLLLALKPGEVSPVVEQPAVYVIFKLEQRRTLDLTAVRNEITQTISRDKLESLTEAVTGPVEVELIDRYFGPVTANRWVPAGGQTGTPSPVTK